MQIGIPSNSERYTALKRAASAASDWLTRASTALDAARGLPLSEWQSLLEAAKPIPVQMEEHNRIDQIVQNTLEWYARASELLAPPKPKPTPAAAASSAATATSQEGADTTMTAAAASASADPSAPITADVKAASAKPTKSKASSEADGEGGEGEEEGEGAEEEEETDEFERRCDPTSHTIPFDQIEALVAQAHGTSIPSHCFVRLLCGSDNVHHLLVLYCVVVWCAEGKDIARITTKSCPELKQLEALEAAGKSWSERVTAAFKATRIVPSSTKTAEQKYRAARDASIQQLRGLREEYWNAPGM